MTFQKPMFWEKVSKCRQLKFLPSILSVISAEGKLMALVKVFSINTCPAEPFSNFQPIRLLDPDCWYKFTYWMANSADPDQLASSEANWSGSTLFAKAVYIRVQPRWLSWMRRQPGDQEVAGSTPAEVGNILSWRLIMKYFLRSFSPFRWFKKGSCQFLAKECAQYSLTA